LVESGTSGEEVAKATLEKYVILAVVHGHYDKIAGTFSFDDINNTMEARDESKKPLTPVARYNLPPSNGVLLVAMETVFCQIFGAVGKGLKWFVFDAGAVHSCEKGGMAVPFAGETYTWKTPFPDCPRN
jgi:hypothetical protein